MDFKGTTSLVIPPNLRVNGRLRIVDQEYEQYCLLTAVAFGEGNRIGIGGILFLFCFFIVSIFTIRF